MFYSPILDLYFKYEKHVHDFLVQLIVIVIAYVVDIYTVYGLNYNHPIISLLVFIICYAVARHIIRLKGKQKLFGGFASYGIFYCIFLSMGIWLAYFLFIRLSRFAYK